MKRILFVVTYFDCGGTCRALQNILNIINPEEFQIDVFGFVESGMYEKGLFKNCHIIPECKALSYLFQRYSSTTGLNRYAAAFSKIVNRLSKNKYNNWLLRRIANKIVSKGDYDLVVAFSEGIVTTFLSYVEHPNKVAWIHCDYASYHQLAGCPNEVSIYSSYKSIVCVSEFTKTSFVRIYPTLKDKTYSIYNVLDDNMMKTQSKMALPNDISFDPEYFNIVSIGRLDPVKRMSLIPTIANHLVNKGDKIRWLVIGPKGGTDKEYAELTDGIRKFNLGEHVLYLGMQSNPYPFIKNADLLVNTSISEACPYVINEAKILGTPIVCTDFGSAKEFIDSGSTGLISPIDDMAETIHQYINNAEIRNHIKDNLNGFKYDNESIIEQFKLLSK